VKGEQKINGLWLGHFGMEWTSAQAQEATLKSDWNTLSPQFAQCMRAAAKDFRPSVATSDSLRYSFEM
jgi:hypothetical protein